MKKILKLIIILIMNGCLKNNSDLKNAYKTNINKTKPKKVEVLLIFNMSFSVEVPKSIMAFLDSDFKGNFKDEIKFYCRNYTEGDEEKRELIAILNFPFNKSSLKILFEGETYKLVRKLNLNNEKKLSYKDGKVFKTISFDEGEIKEYTGRLDRRGYIDS